MSIPSIWPLSESDETRHPNSPAEAWWWWGVSSDRRAGIYVGLELCGDRFDYWAGIVRVDEPYLYIEELHGTDLRDGLEIKPPEMWADHSCDIPFQQWSLGAEAHGVLLDDPSEAWNRAYGTLVPVTFDVEWYSARKPQRIDARDVNAVAPPDAVGGYRQSGEVDCEIGLATGVLHFVGPAERVHVWGGAYLPSSFAMPIAASGLRAPYRRSDAIHVDQVLTDRWWVNTKAANT